MSFDLSLIHLTPADKIDAQGAIKEASGSLLRQQAERDLQKEIAKNAKENWQIPPADFKKLVKIYHNQNLETITEEAEDLVGLYEMVFGS